MNDYGELPVHRWMLHDSVRNEAYRQALAKLVKPGDVVADYGAGTGILSIFAAQAGARRVYAIERSGIAEVARALIERNGLADRIEVIHADLEDVTLPEKVDVIVSEWMGGFGVDEAMFAPLVMARDRWLRPGGLIIPGKTTAYLAPAAIPSFDAELAHWRSKPHGVDTSLLAALTAHETFHAQVALTPDDLLAPPIAMWTHDPYTCSLEEADRPSIATPVFTATRAGLVTGFVAWFTADMGDGTELTNAVGAPLTHWGRTLFPLDRAIEVSAGTPIRCELRCDPSIPGSCEMAWSAQIGDLPVEPHDTRRHRNVRMLR